MKYTVFTSQVAMETKTHNFAVVGKRNKQTLRICVKTAVNREKKRNKHIHFVDLPLPRALSNEKSDYNFEMVCFDFSLQHRGTL